MTDIKHQEFFYYRDFDHAAAGLVFVAQQNGHVLEEAISLKQEGALAPRSAIKLRLKSVEGLSEDQLALALRKEEGLRSTFGRHAMSEAEYSALYAQAERNTADPDNDYVMDALERERRLKGATRGVCVSKGMCDLPNTGTPSPDNE